MKREDKYINRELSWLDFNQRVLYEVLDTERDAISRLQFSAIFSNNLDEFFMVRVSGLIEQVRSKYKQKDIAGLMPEEQLKKIRVKVENLIAQQSAFTKSIIANELREYGLEQLNIEQLSYTEIKKLSDYFDHCIFPALTPMAIDKNRPFPLVLNQSLNIIFKLSKKSDKYATVQVPAVLPRIVFIDDKETRFVLLEDVIKHFADRFFAGTKIKSMGLYRPTRNADVAPNQEVAEDLLVVIEESIKKRRWGEVVRLEVESEMPKDLINYLLEQFEMRKDMVYRIDGQLDLTYLFSLGDYRKPDDIFKVNPQSFYYQEESLFEAIENRDHLIHHPYQSFETIVDFINTAADDDNVLAIKQVLYRVSGDSPIVKALSRAASRGKQVTVVVELMARFDEANNINWAKELEKSGCHVIFGLEGMKTHAKITLVVRRDGSSIKRYLHISSGNYNDKTAKLYTDIGLLTADERLAADASKFFNMLSGYTKQSELQHLLAAPDLLKPEILAMIDREIKWAELGIPAKLIFKCNALVDKDVIDKLYDASQAGVEIILIIRGICCLLPQQKGLSENIQVISIVGDLLEHSRIYYFKNNGKDELYIASADLMPRNLVRRVELMTMVTQKDLKDELLEILAIYINYKKKARYLGANGIYTSAIYGEKDLSAQKALLEYYQN